MSAKVKGADDGNSLWRATSHVWSAVSWHSSEPLSPSAVEQAVRVGRADVEWRAGHRSRTELESDGAVTDVKVDEIVVTGRRANRSHVPAVPWVSESDSDRTSEVGVVLIVVVVAVVLSVRVARSLGLGTCGSST
jgi:hypothetical protein